MKNLIAARPEVAADIKALLEQSQAAGGSRLQQP